MTFKIMMTTSAKDLRSTLDEMSIFLTVEVGDSFTGIYKGFKQIPSRFEPDKQTIELYFEINDSKKTLTSTSLARFLVEGDIRPGDNLKVTKVAKKGNQVTWSVEKLSETINKVGL